MHVDALAAIFAAPDDHHISRLEVAVLHHVEVAVGAQDHACVHAAFWGERPDAIDLEVFREHRRRVVTIRRHAVCRGEGREDVRRVIEPKCSEVRGGVGGKRIRHGGFSLDG